MLQPVAVLLLLAAPLGLQAAALRDLSSAYLASGSDADRSALAEWVSLAPAARQAEGWLALGLADFESERYADAWAALKKAEAGVESVRDYAVLYRGRAFAKSERFKDAAWVLRDFADRFPASSLAADAAQVRAESLIRELRFPEAEEFLSLPDQGFDEADRHYLLARVAHLQSRPLEAVDRYRRVYYFHPRSERAAQAEERLAELSRTMGQSYPAAPAAWRFARANLLFDSRQFAAAAAEYARARPGLKGAEADRARLRQAASSYQILHTTAARNLLASWNVADLEMDAERLYYLAECARRKNEIARYRELVDQLSENHPRSPWREEALFSIGNFYLLRNDAKQYRYYYEQAARVFPKGVHAEKAHWKVCWRAYLDEDPRSRDLFEEHARLYPASGQVSAALYWLARLAQESGDQPQAKGLYQAVAQGYPNYFYGGLSRQRLSDLEAVSARLPVALSAVVDNLTPPRKLEPIPAQSVSLLIERGRLLADIGFDRLAERELTTADYRRPDAHHVGLELARQAARRDDHFRAMRHMKRYGFGYLRFALDALPRGFWERLYPLPYEQSLRSRARPHALDPYLVAGLIRQESEFNPAAVSRAGAIGLMQIMPATGKDLARRLGVSRFSNGRLREPDISLRLGTYHLKGVIDRFQGDLELSLAAYNAGQTRADRWVEWGRFDEPGEFAETIPFTETRGYVQSVLRNRDVYRRLYDGAGRTASAPSRAMLAAGQVAAP